jgi:glycosyltransferase involved in cell wall biosynthesis
MSPRKKVSIVTPFYNEQQGIEAFYVALSNVIGSASLKDTLFEVVCVDDGSSDLTLERLIELTLKDERFQVVELSRNFGKEAALTAGIDVATGDAVVPIDADLQDPPELIERLIEEWMRGAEVVLARRSDRDTDSYLKRTTAAMFYRVHNLLSATKIPENVGDFRLLDRVAVEALKQMPEHHRFMKGMFAWVGYKTTTIDYVRQPRSAGSSKFSGFRLWNFALEGITSFSTVPLRLWSYIGAFCAFITFLYAVATLFKTLIFGVDVPGYASLLLAVLFFGSLQLLSIGIIGEYIGRIYMETKQRPLYLIRRRHGVVK